jgi:hypothetical protein
LLAQSVQDLREHRRAWIVGADEDGEHAKRDSADQSQPSWE